MRESMDLLCQSPLFQGMGRQDLDQMLPCLGSRTLTAQRGELIFRAGEPARWVGLVLTTIQPPELFGEAFASAGVEALPVSVEAAQDSQVLLLDCQRVIHTCSDACIFHQRLAANLLKIVARKNLMLTRKLALLSKRTTKEKLMAYLMEQARLAGSDAFTLPYDRQTLADYLGVDRSAMSAELSKLRRAGLLECKGRNVRLQKPIPPQRKKE